MQKVVLVLIGISLLLQFGCGRGEESTFLKPAEIVAFDKPENNYSDDSNKPSGSGKPTESSKLDAEHGGEPNNEGYDNTCIPEVPKVEDYLNVPEGVKGIKSKYVVSSDLKNVDEFVTDDDVRIKQSTQVIKDWFENSQQSYRDYTYMLNNKYFTQKYIDSIVESGEEDNIKKYLEEYEITRIPGNMEIGMMVLTEINDIEQCIAKVVFNSILVEANYKLKKDHGQVIGDQLYVTAEIQLVESDGEWKIDNIYYSIN